MSISILPLPDTFPREHRINTRTRLARVRLVRWNSWLIRRPKCESGWAASTTGLCKTQNAVWFRTRQSIAVSCYAVHRGNALEIYSRSYVQPNRTGFIRKVIEECFWYWCVNKFRQAVPNLRAVDDRSLKWSCVTHKTSVKVFSYEGTYQDSLVLIIMSNLFA